MNFSTWSIRQPVPAIAAFLVLLMMGLYSFSRLAVTAMPNIDLPLVSIVVSQPGAAPSELVRQVIQPIEDEIASIVGVRHITSNATDSSARSYVEFELETDTDRAVNDVKDAVANVRADLPESIMEPLVHRIDISGMAILTYAVSDPTMNIEQLSDFVDDVVARDLSDVPGVASIDRIGGADRQINVELDPGRIQAFGLTAAEISDQLRAKNIDLGGGRGDMAGTEYSIRALGSADDVARLAATPVLIGQGDSQGRTVRLDELGTVEAGASEERTFALLDGQPVVAFGVFRGKGESDLAAGDGTKARVAQIMARHPGMQITLIDDATTHTAGSYHSTMETLFEGAALAVIVVFLFLRNWRATMTSSTPRCCGRSGRSSLRCAVLPRWTRGCAPGCWPRWHRITRASSSASTIFSAMRRWMKPVCGS